MLLLSEDALNLPIVTVQTFVMLHNEKTGKHTVQFTHIFFVIYATELCFSSQLDFFVFDRCNSLKCVVF